MNRMLVVVVALLSLSAVAQVQPGFPSFGTMDSYQYDSVNLMNNSIVITVPIRSKSGYFPFRMDAFANSYMSTAGGYWNPSMMSTAGYYNGPFITSVNSFVGPLSVSTWSSSVSTTCMGTAAMKYSGFFITGGDGSTHAIDPTLYTTSDSRCNHTLSAVTTDGTGLTINVTGSIVQTVYDKSGRRMKHESATPSGRTQSLSPARAWGSCGGPNFG
jgi:hypothetical protein